MLSGAVCKVVSKGCCRVHWLSCMSVGRCVLCAVYLTETCASSVEMCMIVVADLLELPLSSHGKSLWRYHTSGWWHHTLCQVARGYLPTLAVCTTYDVEYFCGNRGDLLGWHTCK